MSLVEDNAPTVTLVKPTGASLRDRLERELSEEIYDCIICFQSILRSEVLWTCQTCWGMFHLSCAEEWSEKSGIIETDLLGEETLTWRCPACQGMQHEWPDERCFCGHDVPADDGFVKPHSCGNTCSRHGSDVWCDHPCEEICHPGPCPPCTKTAVDYCYCKSESFPRMCSLKPIPRSCLNTCGKDAHLRSSQMRAALPLGPCIPCDVLAEQICYCGDATRVVNCGEGKPFAVTEDSGKTGWFSCKKICDLPFTCNIHTCSTPCHPHIRDLPHPCPLDPSRLLRCQCGAWSLDTLGIERRCCEDEVGVCGGECGKELPCGHGCEMKCHPGIVACGKESRLRCGCGLTESVMLCLEVGWGKAERLNCVTLCRALRNCGRHQCQRACCSRSKNSAIFDPPESDPHFCTLICGRPLSCRNHQCNQPCHKGPCPPCLNVSFTELICSCARTIIQPPIPCSTPYPLCPHPCTRPTLCGHPLSNHPCHPATDPCPPCLAFVKRPCRCGKAVMPNGVCGRETGLVCAVRCERDRGCGHACGRGCCEGGEGCGSGKCEAVCGRKRECGHICGYKWS
ncbi:hypothetical protein BC829DRAFT_75975 [Chytridium lagenaria]|nr:hypothetical protein BC829DRAFT_75975 [Chytridium lagenaria]